MTSGISPFFVLWELEMRNQFARACFAMAAIFCATTVAAQSTVVFNSIPYPTPGNVASLGYQCCATSEFGDEIKLAVGTPRHAGYATVLMSSLSLRANYPALDNAGYMHPITLNIYLDAASAMAHTPVKTVTQNFLIPWRPVADPSCGTAWKSVDGNCYGGYAFPIVFDLTALNYTLPEQFIFGVAYNTNTWGYSPLGVPGPYESLNVGTANVAGVGVSPSVGIDVNPDVVYWNAQLGGFYTDGGVGGTGTFRQDTGWTGFQPAVSFTTYAVAQSAEACKNGGWENLVRSDLSPFRNQGLCVAYVQTGK